MALLRDRSISPLSNRVIVQQEFSLAFTVHQELIRRSNFRDDISPAHTVCTRQEEVHAIFSVSYCIAYLNSFRYGSPICSVSNLPVLRHAIRQFFFGTRSTILMISVFHVLRQIHPMVQHNTIVARPAICVHMPFIVDHSIRLRSTMKIAKDRSHINQTQNISPVYFF